MATSRSADDRPRRRRAGARVALLAAAGLLAALAAAGGGGEDRLSKRAYEERVRTVYAEVQKAFAATAGGAGVPLAERIGTAQKRLREAATALDLTVPPREVEHLNAEVVAGMRAYADRLDVVRAAAARRDRAAIDRFNLSVANDRAVARVVEAAEAMTFMGYDLGRIAEE